MGGNSAKIAPSQWPNYRITATILQRELTRAELNGVSLTHFTEFQMLECIVLCIFTNFTYVSVCVYLIHCTCQIFKMSTPKGKVHVLELCGWYLWVLGDLFQN